MRHFCGVPFYFGKINRRVTVVSRIGKGVYWRERLTMAHQKTPCRKGKAWVAGLAFNGDYIRLGAIIGCVVFGDAAGNGDLTILIIEDHVKVLDVFLPIGNGFFWT